ncbi:MAG: hypothetical protein QF352_02715 [Arenicellales bacterium]|jgi:hypothetical protein|nr:hypothetical protein [Arenicellales bacterium]|tara:strand:+ start:114 stop:884 length:771 start_codon:yes stop_codon:yes gene_type:complete
MNLSTYPIHIPENPETQRLIQDCRSELSENGMCVLPDFVSAITLDRMRQEARSLSPDAHHNEHWRTSPRGGGDSAVGESTKATRASIWAIAFDQMSPDSPSRQLYESDDLLDFVSTITDEPELYRCVDPLVSCHFSVFRDGDELGWHYDPKTNLVVTLQLQDADDGGDFEFANGVRGEEFDNAEIELAIIEDRYDDVQGPDLRPGTLTIINGHSSFHRVTPVVGNRERIVTLLNYSTTPDYCFSDNIRQRFFGRVT